MFQLLLSLVLFPYLVTYLSNIYKMPFVLHLKYILLIKFKTSSRIFLLKSIKDGFEKLLLPETWTNPFKLASLQDQLVLQITY